MFVSVWAHMLVEAEADIGSLLQMLSTLLIEARSLN